MPCLYNEIFSILSVYLTCWNCQVYIREDFKKKPANKMTLCKKGGGCQKKIRFLMYYWKWHFTWGGGLIKTNVIFLKCLSTHHFPVFQLILLHLELNFWYNGKFFPNIDTNSYLIIDCCVNGKVWVKEICKYV